MIEFLWFSLNFRKPEYVIVIFRTFLHVNFFSWFWSILIIKTTKNSRCWLKWVFRLSLGCLYRRYSVFDHLTILSIVIRYDLGIMYYLSKILIRILPWVPLSPRCSKNLVRSCQDSKDASKRVNPGCYGGSKTMRKLEVVDISSRACQTKLLPLMISVGTSKKVFNFSLTPTINH